MIDGLKPYSAYKDSGVAWLGRVPEHWRKLPGRACFTEKKTPNTGLQVTTVLSLSFGRIVVKPPEKLHGLVPASFETYQIIVSNDIVVRPTDLQNDWNSLRFGLAETRGIITSAYMCLRTSEPLKPQYSYLLLHTYDLLKVFYGLGSGLRQNLDWSDFKYLPCLVPPVQEQSAIVRYLGHIDRRIRRYIRAKQKLIGLLEEQKQAIVHRAVTRGLDPNVRLKPSGVEWLGDVPEHWEVRKLKLCVTFQGGGTPAKSEARFWSGNIPWVSPKDMHNQIVKDTEDHITEEAIESSATSVVQPGALLVVVRSGILRRKIPVAINTVPVALNQDMKALRSKGDLDTQYLWALVDSNQSRLLAEWTKHGATVESIEFELMANTPIPIPPMSEQARITAYLEGVVSSLRKGNGVAQREISLLREYRTRLIADVVTGKLDVRSAAANLPEESEGDEFLDMEEPGEEAGQQQVEAKCEEAQV